MRARVSSSAPGMPVMVDHDNHSMPEKRLSLNCTLRMGRAKIWAMTVEATTAINAPGIQRSFAGANFAHRMRITMVSRPIRAAR